MTGIEGRKADHVRLALDDTARPASPAGWDDVRLVHAALPEVDHAAIAPGADFLGRRLALPLCVASMTGGFGAAGAINATLARATERHGLAMGLGSQRAALRDASLRESYAIARREAPSAFLFANVGAAQLVRQGDTPPLTTAEVLDLAGLIDADAVIIHLNALQELVQPEGDRNASGWADAIARVAADIPLPVVAKETGAGVSEAVARRLAACGVAAIDVGGSGGTSFARIEGARASEQRESRFAALATALSDWGIPTAASTALAARAGLPVIATGGIRGGVDAAKAVALGATLVGVARPLLQAAVEGGDGAVDGWIDQFADELRAAMFLSGCASLPALRDAERLVLGATQAWIAPSPRP